MTLALGPGIGLNVLPSGWFAALRSLVQNSPEEEAEFEAKLAARLDNEMAGHLADQSSSCSSSGGRSSSEEKEASNSRKSSSENVALPVGRLSRSSCGSESSNASMKFISGYFSTKPTNLSGQEDEESCSIGDEDDEIDNEFEIVTEAEIDAGIQLEVDKKEAISNVETKSKTSSLPLLETNL